MDDPGADTAGGRQRGAGHGKEPVAVGNGRGVLDNSGRVLVWESGIGVYESDTE